MIPAELAEAYEGRQLIVCVGPGLARAAELPSTEALARELLELASERDPELDRGVVSQWLASGQIAKTLGLLRRSLGSEFEREVENRLSDRGCPTPSLARALAGLSGKLRALYTTNLDRLLERAFSGHWPSFAVPRPDFVRRERFIFKLNGTLELRKSWVLTSEQLERQWAERSLRRNVVQAAYAAHPFLFVAFEPRCAELERLLGLIPHAEDQPSAHFLVRPGCSREERYELARRGISVLDGDAEALLRALAGTTDSESTEPSVALPNDPYPGLEAFSREHAPLFFGRHAEISQAATRLGVVDGIECRWLAIEGASGVGKSSFVRAGVVPAIERGFAAGAPTKWLVAIMRPGERPLDNLADTIADALGLHEGEQLARELLRDPAALLERLRKHTPPGLGFLLVVDQLEEALTFADEQQRPAFGEAIAAALEAELVYLVTTLRSDFVSTLQIKLPALAALLNDHAERYVLPPISRVGLREAISEPALRFGVEIEEQLVELIATDAEELGRGDDELDEEGVLRTRESALPLVAHVLRGLWDAGTADDRNVTVDEYIRVGRITGALTSSANAILEPLDVQECARARELLLRLVRVTREGRDTRRTISREVALSLAGGGERGERLLARLSGARTSDEKAPSARLLVISESGGRARVDLVHEALLREWATLRNWIEQDRRQLLADEELARRATTWREQGKRRSGLPSGLDMAEALRGRPHGEAEPLQREYQALLRWAQRVRWAATIGISASVVVVAVILAVVFRGKQHEATEALQLAEQALADKHEEETRKDAALAEAKLAGERADEALNAQKGLQVSMLADAGQGLEALVLGVQTLGSYAPRFDRAPTSILLGLQDAMDTDFVGEVATCEGHTNEILAMAYSPDGTRIATGSRDSTAKLWDAANGKLVATLEDDFWAVKAVAFSPDGKFLATSGERKACLWDPADGELLVRLDGHEFAALAFSPDGKRVATAGLDGTSKLWNTADGTLLLTLEVTTGTVSGVAFSPDGNRIVTLVERGTSKLWDAAHGELLGSFTAHREIRALAFSSDGTRFITMGDETVAKLWDTTTLELLASLEGNHQISALAFSPTGQRIAIANDFGAARLWDSDGKPLAALDGHTDSIAALVFSPDGSRIASASWDRSARLWDANDGKPLASLHGHFAVVTSIAFAPDGRRIATASWDSTMKIWQPAAAEPLTARSLDGHHDMIADVSFSPDGQRIATAGHDGTAKLWDAASGELRLSFDNQFEALVAVAFAPDGTRLATAGRNGNAMLWDASSGKSLAMLSGHADALLSLSFSPDGQRLVTSSRDGTAKLWDAGSGKPLVTLASDSANIWWAVFSPDGQRLATTNLDHTAKLWNAADGKLLLTLTGHSNHVNQVAFSPDGLRVATSSEDNTSRIWDSRDGKLLAALDGHAGPFVDLAYSSDGRRIATAHMDNKARLWDASDGKLIATLDGHELRVFIVAFSPDGKLLATGSEDSTARLWDASDGKPLLLLEGHAAAITDLTFSPDGLRIATASADTTVGLWDISPATQLRRACERLRPFLAYARVAEHCAGLDR
jgi:WD40 repeat protein